MEEKKRKIILYSIVSILILTELATIIEIFQIRAYSLLFWACYFLPIIIIIGLLKKNSSIVLSQIIIFFIPILLWFVDFVHNIITGNSLLGLLIYLPNSTQTILQKIVSTQHIYTIPLSILALFFIKVKKRDYKVLLISLSEIVILFFLSHLSSEDLNVNCVYHNCSTFPLLNIPWAISWFLIMSAFIFISYFIINLLLSTKKN